MSKKEKFSWKKRLKSFTYAFNGIKTLFEEEHNARIHLVFAILAVILGFVFCISASEWFAILLCIAIVFSLELVNSSIENLADKITSEQNEFIRKSKDMAAAAVLIAAIISLIIGVIIFLPKILDIF